MVAVVTVAPASEFPRLRAGTFIEAEIAACEKKLEAISPPSGGDFVTTLNANREVSRGLRSPVLETTLVSRTGLFSLKHEDTLDTSPTENSSGQLFGCEMTKPDARNLW